MPIFAYQAVDATGRESAGTLEANDRAGALKVLSGRGLQPFKVSESANAAKAAGKNAKPASAKEGKLAKNVGAPAGPIPLSLGQLQLFTEELAELMEAGMRLEPALKLMQGKVDEKAQPYRLVARKLGDLVREGHPFSSALKVASPSFGELFCSVAAAGEAGGSLGQSMRRQAAYIAASRDMRSQVAVALIYPGFLLVAGIGVTVLFITFLIPRLMTLIQSTRGKIPPIASFLIQVSDFLKTNWLFVLLGIIAMGVGFSLFIKSKTGRPVWDKMKLKLPFVGGVLSSSFHSQFLETLASLSVGGLPLLKGLELASRVTTNTYCQSHLTKANALVQDGGSLSRALEKTSLFPGNLVEMVRLGEHTGDLPAALRRAADRCARDLGKALEKAAAAIQPVIILLMAGIVGLMAYLMISIIFDTVQALQKQNKRTEIPTSIQTRYDHYV
jgi:type II secretory pathway component PulF